MSPMRRADAPPLPSWITAMLPPVRRFLADLDGTRIHVMEAGDPDGRPVLMLHGNPTWSFLYRKVVQALLATPASRPLRFVMPDLLGLGLSDKPRDARAHTIEHHAQLIGGVVDGLALRDPIFVGQDWGGPIGLRMLADRPGLLRGLVLLNTVVGPPREGFKPALFHRFARVPIAADLLFRGLGLPQRMLWMVQGDKQSISGDVARAYAWPLRGLGNNLAPIALARMVPFDMHHVSIPPLQICQQVVSAWRGPTAIVWGDRDPVLGRVRSHIERLLPQARVTRTQAGHFLQEEVPHEIADGIRSVVAQL